MAGTTGSLASNFSFPREALLEGAYCKAGHRTLERILERETPLSAYGGRTVKQRRFLALPFVCYTTSIVFVRQRFNTY